MIKYIILFDDGPYIHMQCNCGTIYHGIHGADPIRIFYKLQCHVCRIEYISPILLDVTLTLNPDLTLKEVLLMQGAQVKHINKT